MSKLAAALIAWGPLGVMLIATLDSAGIPLPTGVDTLLIAVAAVNPAKAYLAALLATIGSVAGNIFLYWLARKGGEAYLERHTQSKRAQRFSRWFRHYGLITVFIPTVVPIIPLPLKVFVLTAGATGISLRAFALTILAGRIPRFLAMAYLGAQLGRDSMAWLRGHVWALTAIAAWLFLILFGAVKYIDYRRRREAGGTAGAVGVE